MNRTEYKERKQRVLQALCLGDKVGSLVERIPGIKKLPCYDKDGNLIPTTGCGKRKAILNGE